MKPKTVVDFENTDVVILCGGLGTRFREVSQNCPKSMADIWGRPFLDFILEQFFKQGSRRFILCIGYKGKHIKDYYQNNKYSKYLLFSQEDDILGTAGAIKNAEKYIKSKFFFVANGDSFCQVDLHKFLNFFHSKQDVAGSILLVKHDGRNDIGQVLVNSDSLIVSFREKAFDNEKAYLNAGIYIISKKVLALISSNQQSSLEYDIFPKLVGKNLYGFTTKKKVYDIGTPERYKEFLKVFKSY